MTHEEIELRRAEIAELLKSDDADLDALEAEVRSLNEQDEAIRAAAAAAAEERAAVANGEVGTTIKETIVEENAMSERTFAVDTVEYRDAYLKNLMGKALDAEERAALTSAGAVIPTETLNKVYDLLRENPLINELDVLHIPGYVSVPKAKTVNDANWVAMGTAATDSADVVEAVALSAYKLIKTVEITADIQALAVPAFQDWLTRKLAEKMAAAICKAVLAGTGTNQPTGVMDDGTKVTKAFSLAGLSEAMGSLPSAYHTNAVWVMSATTFFKNIVPLAQDSNGVLVMNGIEYRFLGHKVVLDDNAAAKIVFGNFKDGYAFNFAKDIAIEADNSVAFRTGSTVYRAMALADGKPVQSEAFVIVTAAA